MEINLETTENQPCSNSIITLCLVSNDFITHRRAVYAAVFCLKQKSLIKPVGKTFKRIFNAPNFPTKKDTFKSPNVMPVFGFAKKKVQLSPTAGITELCDFHVCIFSFFTLSEETISSTVLSFWAKCPEYHNFPTHPVKMQFPSIRGFDWCRPSI